MRRPFKLGRFQLDEAHDVCGVPFGWFFRDPQPFVNTLSDADLRHIQRLCEKALASRKPRKKAKDRP
jgi:hypothetical protein